MSDVTYEFGGGKVTLLRDGAKLATLDDGGNYGSPHLVYRYWQRGKLVAKYFSYPPGRVSVGVRKAVRFLESRS